MEIAPNAHAVNAIEPAVRRGMSRRARRDVLMFLLAYTRPQASVISLGKGTEILRQMVEKLLVGGLPPQQVMRETAADLRKEDSETF